MSKENGVEQSNILETPIMKDAFLVTVSYVVRGEECKNAFLERLSDRAKVDVEGESS